MPKTHDIVAITGTYQKDGQDKPRFQNVGMMIEKDGKQYIKLNQMVTMHDDGHVVNFFNIYPVKNSQQGAPQQARNPDNSNPGPLDDFDSDIPF